MRAGSTNGKLNKNSQTLGMQSKNIFSKLCRQSPLLQGFAAQFLLLSLSFLIFSCNQDTPPVSYLGQKRDSAAIMTTLGVSKLISDSGYMRYRIIAEEWRVYDKTKPPRQEFPKGIFLQRFDKNFKMDLFIQADSAWCFNQNLWRLKGHVIINDMEQHTFFRTAELFWDMEAHRLYSNTYMKITQPNRELEGDRFTANERMTDYHIYQSKGFFSKPEEKGQNQSDEKKQVTDSALQQQRPAPTPIKKE